MAISSWFKRREERFARAKKNFLKAKRVVERLTGRKLKEKVVKKKYDGEKKRGITDYDRKKEQFLRSLNK